MEEANQLTKYIKSNKAALQADPANYTEICFETGKLYWYYYDYGDGTDNQVTRAKSAVEWFQDVLDNAPEVNLYMEYSNKTCLDNVLRLFRDLNLKVLNMEITRSTETETHNACALFTLRLNKRCRVEQLIPKMNATEGVVSVEEL